MSSRVNPLSVYCRMMSRVCLAVLTVVYVLYDDVASVSSHVNPLSVYCRMMSRVSLAVLICCLCIVG